YTIGIYIIINSDTVKNGFGKLFLLFVLICGFRLEHGLFFLTIILLYSWIRAKGNANLRALVIVMVPIAIVVMSPFLLGKFQDNTEIYENQIERVERTEASTAATLNSLPPGIKQIS